MVEITKCPPAMDGGKGLEPRRSRFAGRLPNGVILLGPDQSRPAKASRPTWDSLLRADTKRLARQYAPPRRCKGESLVTGKVVG